MKECTMRRHFVLVTVILLCAAVKDISGLSSGPPSGACSTFKPSPDQHGLPQSGASPYEIQVSKANYSADETIEVTLQSTDGSNIKGFLITARTVSYDPDDVESSAVGSFAMENNTKQNCNDKSLSHSTPLTLTSLQLQWTAPSATVGDIVFQASVVKEKVIFWTGVLSSELTVASVTTDDPNATDDPTETSTRAASTEDFSIDLGQCGSTKGCFRRPAGCNADDCDVAATWSRPEGASYVEIEMVGKQEGWIALGFSDDNFMFSDYVIRCIRNGDVVSVENSYNLEDAKFNSPFADLSLGLSEQKTSYANGILKCSCRRLIALSSARKKRQSDTDFFSELDQEYVLFLGFGSAISGSLEKHEVTPVVSSEKVTVTTDRKDVGADLSLFKVHGILMILAWIILIDISLLIARFYKDAWPEHKIVQKHPWFPIHVFMNILAVVFTLIAFIVIFVAIGGYSQFSDDASNRDVAHPVIGIIITVLAVVNPIMAIFRCAPDDPNRAIFNWFHWAVGTVAEILAIVNIFFGIGLDRSKSFTPDWVLWVLVAYVIIHGLVVITLEVHRCYLQKEDKRSDQALEMKAKASEKQAGEQILFENQHSGLRFKYAMLVFYGLSTLGCGLAVIIGIGSTE